MKGNVSETESPGHEGLVSIVPIGVVEEVPRNRKRGRPFGSKNKRRAPAASVCGSPPPRGSAVGSDGTRTGVGESDTVIRKRKRFTDVECLYIAETWVTQ